MFDLAAIQRSLREFGIDGWLLYDFRASNVLARRVLDMEARPAGSRRFLYMIPVAGARRSSSIASSLALWITSQERRSSTSRGRSSNRVSAGSYPASAQVAMEYAGRVSNPYVSKVDAGTIEVVRNCGIELVSSGDLIQQFEATWDDEQWAMHLAAEQCATSAFDLAWSLIADRIRAGETIRETEVQAAILDHFQRHGMTTYSPPIVAAGPNSGDPHYEPLAGDDAVIGPDDFVLIDLWCKLDKPRAVYSDLTRVAYVGTTVPEKYERIFAIVAAARDAAVACASDAFATGRPLRGFEVDDTCRKVIEDAGYGPYFIHRTGHNIGQEVHGNGAHMDNLETHEERLVLRRTCFSVEPGIYQAEFGVRSEINVFVDAAGKVHVTGGLQRCVVPILAQSFRS